ALSDGVRLFNFSVGYYPDCHGYQNPAYWCPVLSDFRAVIRSAFLQGVFIAAAVGNDGTNVALAPADFSKEVVGVGAILGNGQRWTDAILPTYMARNGGSNYGPAVDVVGPGGRYVAQDVAWYSPHPVAHWRAYGPQGACTYAYDEAWAW